MTSPNADLAAAIRRERERAIREAMAICNRLQPGQADWQMPEPRLDAAFRDGHRHARMQLYDELERMIAREAPAATVPAPRQAEHPPRLDRNGTGWKSRDGG